MPRDGSGTTNAEMDPDIIELLRDEYQDLRELFSEVLNAEPLARTEPFQNLVSRLAAHEPAEEALVRNVSREVPGGEEPADMAREREAEAERMLADMEKMALSSDEFVVGFQELEAAVLEHAAHEEQHEFPLLVDHLTITRRRELASRSRCCALGPTRPHPMTPQSPAVRAVTGPVVGTFDGVRDAVRDALKR